MHTNDCLSRDHLREFVNPYSSGVQTFCALHQKRGPYCTQMKARNSWNELQAETLMWMTGNIFDM